MSTCVAFSLLTQRACSNEPPGLGCCPHWAGFKARTVLCGWEGAVAREAVVLRGGSMGIALRLGSPCGVAAGWPVTGSAAHSVVSGLYRGLGGLLSGVWGGSPTSPQLPPKSDNYGLSQR